MMGRIAGDFTIEAFTTGSALQIGFGVGDGLIVTLFMMLVLAVGVVKERGCNLWEWATAQSALLRWSLVILLFVGTVTFGAYGLGYTPVDPMYAQFRSMHESSETTQRLQGACDRGFRGGCNARPSLGGIERRPAEKQPEGIRPGFRSRQRDLRRAGPLPRCDIHRRQRGVQLVLPVADVGRAWLHLVRKRYVGSAIDVRVPIAGKSASFPKAQGRRIRNELHLLADQPDDAVLSLFQNKLPVFEYHDRWKSLDAQDFLGKPSATWSDPLKGFVVNRGVNPADAVNHMTPSSEALPVDVVNRQYITAMVEACRANGATPVFVSTPSTVNWNTAKHNGMSELARELGVDYYDLNEGPDKVPIDWSTDTHDKGDHLNFDGATKVSAYMGKLLSEKYGLPDHRSDSAFDRWNASLERYKQQIAS